MPDSRHPDDIARSLVALLKEGDPGFMARADAVDANFYAIEPSESHAGGVRFGVTSAGEGREVVLLLAPDRQSVSVEVGEYQEAEWKRLAFVSGLKSAASVVSCLDDALALRVAPVAQTAAKPSAVPIVPTAKPRQSGGRSIS